MLEKLVSFCSHAITNISTLISIYFIFCKSSNILKYIMIFLYNNRFFYDNIENMSNLNYYYKIFFRINNMYIGLKTISNINYCR